MKHILTLTIRLVLSMALFFVGVDTVRAEACGLINGVQVDCAGGWYCINGSCVQNSGCWENVCQAPNTCMGDICMPAGGGTTCECGVRADGRCRACSVACNISFQCPVGTTPDWSSQSFYACRHWSDGKICDGSDLIDTGSRGECVARFCDPEAPLSSCKLNQVNRPNCVPVCTVTSPSNLAIVQGASYSVANMSWTPGSNGSYQLIRVDEDLAEVNAGCPTPNDCEVNGQVAAGTASYIATGLLPNTTYHFRVVNYVDASCNQAIVGSYTTPSQILAGRVYLDSNNNCSTANPWSLGGLTVSVRGTAYSGSVGSDGRFSFFGGNDNPISYLDLAGFGGAYTPSTAPGCNQGATLTSITNPSSSNYFYLTPLREAWWQAIGGSVYAGGNVRSEIPSAGFSLIADGTNGEVGALMRASGSVDTGLGTVSSAGYSATTRYRGKMMNYDYFAAHMGVTPNTANYWAVDTLSLPGYDPERSFYYHNPSGSEASVSVPWTISAGQSYVVFVNGDLRIASNIEVEPGGFLAFMVNGSLRVSPAVAQVEGLYVVDGTLITESNGSVDMGLSFEGSMVAWGGVNLGRDLVSGNSLSAGESFRYRPDLLLNMPDSMKVFALKWEEVVPGSF